MPLLRGQAEVQARATLADLSARFLKLPMAKRDLSLVDGLPGIALAHMAFDRVFPDAGHRARAERVIQRTMDRVATEPLGPSLFSGLAGVGWVFAHVVEGEEGDDFCAPFDAALNEALDAPTWEGPYDLLTGLVGVGVYALERVRTTSGRELLGRVVDHLAATARPRDRGISWFSQPEWVPESVRTRTTFDWNLGVAHGVPGIVALLALVVASNADARTRERGGELLEGAVAWVLDQELPADAEGCFAAAVAPELPRKPARLGWCYGDPGVAVALLLAARATGHRAWEEAALRVALRAASRPEATSGVEDAGLCHGSAGAGHIFHRLARATGDERLADAARAWFERALAMRDPARGFGGFRAFRLDERGVHRWQRDPGFLTGAAGVALALEAAITDADPRWDRVLLLS